MIRCQHKISTFFPAAFNSALEQALNLSLAHEDAEIPATFAASSKASFSASVKRIWNALRFTNASGFFGRPLFPMIIIVMQKKLKNNNFFVVLCIIVHYNNSWFERKG
ncbi:MAG: hypothetical protein JW795_03800 [Chitinivibrionales bacterium]|nr:hypothetical protein [Chitinivibrionales bacterium]